MARDARLIIGKALKRLYDRYEKDADKREFVLEVEKEIEYAFDLAQIPKTPGPKSKPAKTAPEK